ncbi:MAG: amidohydrolase/deacetylase family metallohydrolase [Bacillota bacterium]
MALYELVLKGGKVIDPAASLSGLADVAVAGGKVAAVGPNLSGKEVIDVSGKIVTPGLIDLHTHVFTGTVGRVSPDKVGVQSGITTVVDAGSVGALTFMGFKELIVDRAKTRVFEFINIAHQGIINKPEADSWEKLSVESVMKVEKMFPNIIKGVKCRASATGVGNIGIEAVKIARTAAKYIGKPLMVHIGHAPPVIEDILSAMRKDDILTHAFHGKPGGLFEPDGKALPETREAVARGVRLDIGHGSGSLGFNAVRWAQDAGIDFFSLSTDVHSQNVNGPVFDLAWTVSKFLALGYDLYDLIAKTTIHPAQALGEEARLGSLRPGMLADVSVFDLVEGDYRFTDSYGATIKGTTILRPALVLRDGQVVGRQ